MWSLNSLIKKSTILKLIRNYTAIHSNNLGDFELDEKDQLKKAKRSLTISCLNETTYFLSYFSELVDWKAFDDFHRTMLWTAFK